MLDPAEIIKAAIRSAFVSYPREDDPDWRSCWIKAEECSHLAAVIVRELEANGRPDMLPLDGTTPHRKRTALATGTEIGQPCTH